jgi:hypothetical protein
VRTVLVSLVAVAVLASPAGGQVQPAQQISVDPFQDALGQHETAVEPDSISFGNSVVAAFQVGRTLTAGASGIGWASSADGGNTWRSGVLPSLVAHGTPSGPFTRATDPAVAYDSAHGVWLISILGLRDGPSGTNDELLSSLVVSRSTDGISWSSPVVTSPEQEHFSHDKNWIVCDNGTSSPFRGRCYVAWTAVIAQLQALAVASSTDGGLSWSQPTVVTSIRGSGWQPLVRPDGTLTIVYITSREVRATRSSDGGRSFSAPAVVSTLRDSRIPGMRAPSLPSAEADRDGHITAAWVDCRFRTGCGARITPTDVVISTSSDGVRWTRVRRVPTGHELEALPHFVTGLGVDPSTGGSTTRLGITFYVLMPRGCSKDCLAAPFFVASDDGGRGWSSPEQLAPPQRLEAFANTTTGRFVGDYISTSFVSDGVAVPVFAAAARSFDGRYHQGVFATAVPPQRSTPVLEVGSSRVTRRGKRVVVSVPLVGLTSGLQIRCRVERGRSRMRAVARTVANGRATCTWVVRGGRSGQRITGTILLTTPEVDLQRPFALRTR